MQITHHMPGEEDSDDRAKISWLLSVALFFYL